MRDKVIQTENDYDKDVFNWDVGIVERVDPVEQQVAIRFDGRIVKYDFAELDEVSLAYAVTIHKSQGSEFPAVVIRLATQHYMLLQRNLIYTGQAAACADRAEEGAGHCRPQRPSTEAVFRAARQPVAIAVSMLIRFRLGLYTDARLDRVAVRGLADGSVQVTKVGEWSSVGG